MSRRRSAIRYVHAQNNLDGPLNDATLNNVWEGIRRTHATKPDRALPLMPPLLWQCLDTIPTTNKDATPSLSGLRDRVLLLVGFAGAFRVSELLAVNVEDLDPADDKGIVVHLGKTKTDQTGQNEYLKILPRSKNN